MDSADLRFNNIRVSLDLFKHCSICLSQEVHGWSEGPLRSAMDPKMDILADEHGPSSPNTNFRRTLATYHPTHSGALSFPRTPFPAISTPPIGVDGVSPVLPTLSDFPAIFQVPSATPIGSLGPYCPLFRLGRGVAPSIGELWIIVFNVCLTLSK